MMPAGLELLQILLSLGCISIVDYLIVIEMFIEKHHL